MAGSQIDSPYLQMKGRAILANDFSPSFRLSLAAKDAGLVLEAAERGRRKWLSWRRPAPADAPAAVG